MTSARVPLLIGLLCAIPYFGQRTNGSSKQVSSRAQTSLNVDVNLVLLNTTVTDRVTGISPASPKNSSTFGRIRSNKRSNTFLQKALR